VTFTPTQVGSSTGTLTITDNSAGSPHTVQLFGTGGQASVVPSPSPLSFASQAIGTTSSEQPITLTNSGALNAGITQIQVSGDFTETNNCPFTLNPTATCTVQVTFTPTATGARTGTLTITDNAPNKSANSFAERNGRAPPSLGLAVATGGSSSATVAAGTTAKYSLAIGGQGVSGTASLTCTGAPTGATCTVPATETVSAATVTTFSVSVTTTSRTVGALRHDAVRRMPWLWAFALMAGVVVYGAERNKKRPAHRYLLWLPLLLLAFLCSCGGSSDQQKTNPNGTPAGSYTLTVTAAVGTTTQPMTLTLKVQ